MYLTLLRLWLSSSINGTAFQHFAPADLSGISSFTILQVSIFVTHTVSFCLYEFHKTQASQGSNVWRVERVSTSCWFSRTFKSQPRQTLILASKYLGTSSPWQPFYQPSIASSAFSFARQGALKCQRAFSSSHTTTDTCVDTFCGIVSGQNWTALGRIVTISAPCNKPLVCFFASI